jgi:hypothetical protein
MHATHLPDRAFLSPLRAVAMLSLAVAIVTTGCKINPLAPPDDAALTQSVQAKIAGESSLQSEQIQASVQQGVATLTGTVSSDAARSLAANDAAQVAGIRTVVNDLTVQAAGVPTAPAPPTHAASNKEKIVRQPKPSARIDRPQPPPAAVQEAAAPEPAPIERQPPAPVTRPANPVPVSRSMTLPADTTIAMRITQTLDSATTQQGETFSGVLASDIVSDGITVLPQGTPVSGRVVAVQEAAHFKGNSLLTIELTSIDRHGEHLPITTDSYSKEGNGRGKNTAEKIGGGAAVGAILGGIFGGGKGAAIGAAAGGGAGTAVQGATRGKQVQIPSETLVRFRLASPVTVRVSGDGRGGDGLQQRNN